MRKLTLVLVVLCVIFGVFFFTRNTSQKRTEKPASKISNDQILESGISQDEEYVFVPYWTMDENIDSSPTPNLIYFGVEANTTGINTDEDGYKNIKDFANKTHDKKTYLAVRMVDSDTNLKILKDKSIQKKIMSEAVDLAQQNDFAGIVLDFEIQGLPFESFVQSITDFNTSFYNAAHNKQLSYGIAIYGDAFYRVRPFNIEEIAKHTDHLFVMAYDFSKARGDPGPNFPFDDKKYGYGFTTLVRDYLHVVPKEKLTIIFGMFGYAWKIDSEGRSKEVASSKTTLQFEKFATQCTTDNSCSVKTSKGDGTTITYTDEDKRIVWFEDYDSVKEKTQYLSTQGLHSIGYWAYSYY